VPVPPPVELVLVLVSVVETLPTADVLAPPTPAVVALLVV
jgi:hypothetical protein